MQLNSGTGHKLPRPSDTVRWLHHRLVSTLMQGIVSVDVTVSRRGEDTVSESRYAGGIVVLVHLYCGWVER